MKEQDYQINLLKVISGQSYLDIENIIIPAGTLTVKKALEVYQNDYLYRLSDSLGQAYEATHTLLGDEDFFKLTKDYIKSYPSCTTDLNEYGENFPPFILKNYKSESIDLIYTTAEFEKMFWEIFHQDDVPYFLNYQTQEDFLKQKLRKDIKLLKTSYDSFKIFNDTRENNFYFVDSYAGSFYFLLFKKNQKVICEKLNSLDFEFFESLKKGSNLQEAIELTYVEASDVQRVFKFLALNFM